MDNKKKSNKYADEIRLALNRFIDRRGLDLDPWCKATNGIITEAGLRHFRSGVNTSVGMDKLMALAAVLGLTLSQMLEEGGFQGRIIVGEMKKGKIFPIDGHSLIPQRAHLKVVQKNEKDPGKNKN